jgi:glycosyltransferase involved in cell wall biosynthesis
MNVSIIIPTFNEEETIKEFFKKVKEIKPQLKSFELIIVDDSLDKTAEIARSLMKRFKIKGSVLKRIGKRGKGSAIRDGLKLAKGKYIVLIDADLQYPVEKIPALVEKLKECDIVNTRRLRKDPFYRKLLG